MKKKNKKIATLFVAAVVMIGGLTACGGGNADGADNNNADSSVNTQLNGTLTMAGSTSMEKLANALAEGFMTANPGVAVAPEFNGSTAGIEQMLAGTVEIGNASRNLKEGEVSKGAIGYVSLDVLNDTVIAVSIDGVEATEANIVAGSYSLSRPFVMATKGEIKDQSELVQAFFAYIESEEGQAIIKQVGLILPE